MLAIRHALLLEDLPDGDLPLSPAPLSVTIKEAREYVASVVPFGFLPGRWPSRTSKTPRPSSKRSCARRSRWRPRRAKPPT